MGFVDKYGSLLELDFNMFNIYIEPRTRSLLLEITCEEETLALDYFTLKNGVVNWKDDHDYSWLDMIQKIKRVLIYEGESWVHLQTECTVCMGEEQQCYTLCGHVVCQECLKRWWQQGKNSCPMCRSYLDDGFMTDGNYY